MNILELTFKEFAQKFKNRYGKGPHHANMLYQMVYQNLNPSFKGLEQLINSVQLCGILKKNLSLNLSPRIKEKREEGLIKFVTRLSDGLEIESVVIPMHTHQTVCISTQAGCRLGCSFCETAQMGFKRNLTIKEIVEQVYSARYYYGPEIRNVVFMGMGEPLDNFDNVIQSIRVMEDQKGLSIAQRHITLSTACPKNGIERLAKLELSGLNLAISLNAPNDAIRSRIMPVNESQPMKKIQRALLNYPLKKSGRFLIEYVIIKGLNDSLAHARELAEFLKPLKAKVNIIPLNPRQKGKLDAPSEEAINQFSNCLKTKGLVAIKRMAKGRKVLAACGQLGGKDLSTFTRHTNSPIR